MNPADPWKDRSASRPPLECPVPHWYYIDIGNICNLKCPFCRTGNGLTPAREKGLMSRETFDLILSKIERHARYVCLFNWGEPFLNKHLLYMIRALAERGIKSHLDSNLTLRDFSDLEAEEIVRSGLFSLFASIDGATQESYEKYRVAGRLDRALHNLRQLVRARERLRMETPGLLWAFYLNRYNEDEIDLARDLAKEIGVEIWFKLLSAPPDFQTKYATTGGPVLMPPSSLAHWHPSHIANETLPEFGLHPVLHVVCRQPFTVGVINWNGDVYPCCAVGGDEFKLGNIVEQELEEVWNGAPLRSCRSFLTNFGPVQNGDSVCENVCTAVPSHA
jgi:radical SAM protein with 4Fe4S-binding SPASM domain